MLRLVGPSNKREIHEKDVEQKATVGPSNKREIHEKDEEQQATYC
jgi:hypothetical protein